MVRRRHLILVLICATTCLAGAEEKQAEKAPSPEMKRLEAQLDLVLKEVNFAGQGLADVLDFMRDVTDANIFVNWRALNEIGINTDSPVKLHLQNAKFRNCLAGILKGVETKKGKVQFTNEDGLLVITAVPDPKNPPAKMTVSLPEKNDVMIPDINFAGQGVSDVFDFLGDLSHLKFKVDVVALEKAGIKRDEPVTVRVKHMKLSTCIRFILEDISGGKTPLQCLEKDGVVTVTTSPKPEKTDK